MLRLLSLPSWERGLKYLDDLALGCDKEVAPLVGAWIEILLHFIYNALIRSLPSWERGLKYSVYDIPGKSAVVAPLVGAWIEIPDHEIYAAAKKRRSPPWERGLKFHAKRY